MSGGAGGLARSHGRRLRLRRPEGVLVVHDGRPGERSAADPPAVLYRHLAGKENAILDGDTERQVFLLLGEHDIAAHCYHYDDTCRIEEFYVGRTLTADDVFDPEIQRGVADELFRFHQLDPRRPARPDVLRAPPRAMGFDRPIGAGRASIRLSGPTSRRCATT